MTMWTSVKSFFGRGDLATKTDPTYQVSTQFYSTGQPIWSDRNYASFVKEGYKKCGSVYACINKIAGAAASIKWKLYTDPTMSREIESHKILDLWKRPNARMGTAEMIEQLFGFWHMDGNCYLWANQPNPNEPPTELWPLHPNLIKVVAGPYDIQGYVYGWGTGRAQSYKPDELMHLKFTSYDDKPHYGLSPLEVAMRTIDQMNAGNDWNTALMQNDGKPSALFTSKGYLDVEQRTQIKRELRAKYSGKGNAGKPLVLEADMGYQSMAIPPKELDWLASRGFNQREIATILDVPPILVGDQTGQTYANLKEAKQSLFTENVLPKMYRMVDHINIWLVPMYDDLKRSGAYLSYDRKDIDVLAELYTSVEQAFAERALNLWNNGGCSLRYLQEVQGMEPKKSTYLDVYKLGPTSLVREADLEAYAVACLEKLSAPPPVPLGQLGQPGQPPKLPEPEPEGLPALPAPKPKPKPGTTTVTEVLPDTDTAPTKERQSVPGHKVKVLDLVTKEEKAAYMAKVEADRAPWERDIASRMQAYFEDERNAVVKAIAACSIEQEVDEAVSTALSGQQDALTQVIYDAWIDVSVAIGGQVAASLSSGQAQKGMIADFIKLFGESQIKYLLLLAATKVKQISTTTEAKIRLELTDGVAHGESIQKLAKRIDDLYLQQIIPNRSVKIARTEVVGSSNYASLEAAKQSGLTLNKVWLATEDARTRPDHADADGQEVGIDEQFDVGGVKMDRPGDGPTDQVICCRCAVYFKRVKATVAEEDKTATPTRREFKSVREFMEVLV